MSKIIFTHGDQAGYYTVPGICSLPVEKGKVPYDWCAQVLRKAGERHIERPFPFRREIADQMVQLCVADLSQCPPEGLEILCNEHDLVYPPAIEDTPVRAHLQVVSEGLKDLRLQITEYENIVDYCVSKLEGPHPYIGRGIDEVSSVSCSEEGTKDE